MILYLQSNLQFQFKELDMVATLQQIFSASVSKDSELVAVKQKIFREFDDNLLNFHPQELLVIVDGTVFSLKEEDDYDKFVKKFEDYFQRRNAKKKILTVSFYQT